MSTFRAPVVLFLKATTTKTITVPGYTRKDGTYVPPHTKVVHFDPSKSAADVLAGNGSHSQKVALKKLSKLPHWHALPDDEKHAHVLSVATNHQKKQSAAAAVSGWKAAMLAGEKPKPAQQAAFDALDPAKKDALLAEVGAVTVSTAGEAKPDGGAETGADAGGAGVTVISTKKVSDPLEGTTHVVTFSNGATATLIKLNSSESMGLPGWHDAGKVGAPSSAGGSYLADTKDEAIALLLAKQQATPADGGTLASKPDLSSGAQAVEPVAEPAEPAEQGGDGAQTAPSAFPSFADHDKADAEDESAAAQIDALVSGTGGHYPVKAAKAITAKLKDDPAFLSEWGALSHVKRLQKIVDLAKEMQAEATAAAAVSMWNKAAKSGKNPTPAQWKAFYALPAGKKAEMLSAVHAAAGGTGHLVAPALPKAGAPDVSGLVDDEKPAAAAPAAPALKLKPVAMSEASSAFEAEGMLPTVTASVAEAIGYVNHGQVSSLIGAYAELKDGGPAALTKKFAIVGKLAGIDLDASLAAGKPVAVARGADAGAALASASTAGAHSLDEGVAIKQDGFVPVINDPAVYSSEPNKHPPDAHYDAAYAAGYSMAGVKSAAGDMVYVFKKDGQVLTQAGMDALLGGGGADGGPKDGDTKTGANGQQLVFKNGRWHKVVAADEHGEVPPVLVPVEDDAFAALFADQGLNSFEQAVVDGHFENGDSASLQDVVDHGGSAAIKEYAAQKLAEMQSGADAPPSPSDGQAPSVAGSAGLGDAGGDQGAQTGPDVAGQPADWDVFHNTEPGHNKFWSVAVVGDSMVTHYGKIGTKGTTTVKHFDKPGAALAAASKLQKQKEAKGYKFQGGQSYPVPGDVKAAPKPASATVKQKPAIESADGWPQTGPQAGSNPGGRFKDPSGQEWYIKTPATEAHAKNELLAAKLYEAAGVKVPELKLVMKDGKTAIASKWVDGMSKAGHPDELALADGALSGFAVDAWLANWDVTGLGLDNLLVGPDGKAVRIDVGGSLLFRAQGEPKGSAFGDDVTELQSLMDPKKNPLSAALFGGMSKAAAEKSAERVLAISNDQIIDLVQQFGPGSQAERAALAQKLIARKDALAKEFPKAKGAGQESQKKPVYRIPTPPDFKNWHGAGKGLSSKPAYNDQNQELAVAIYEAGKAGNLEAVKSLTYQPISETGEPVGDPKPISDHPSQHIRAYQKDMLHSMVTPYVSPKVSAEQVLKRMSAAFLLVRKLFPGFKALKDAAHKIGRYALLGKAQAGHPLEGWSPSLVSRKQGTLDEKSLYKASMSNFSKLSAVEKQAIKDYTGSSYDSMNSALIQGKNHNKAYNAIKGVDKASVMLPAGAVISRRFSFDKAADGTQSKENHEKALADLLAAGEGSILQEFGIISTSTRSDFWSGRIHLKITIGEGVKGLYVANNPEGGGGAISVNPGESEIMLPFGTKFMVTKIHKKGHSFSDETGSWGKKPGDEMVIEVTALPNV